MRRLTLMALLAVSMMPAVALAAIINPEPSIVPAVREWRGGPGSLGLSGAPIVISKPDADILRPTAELLRGDLVNMGFAKPEIIIGEKSVDQDAIVLVRTEKPVKAGGASLAAESYALDIGGHAAVISSHGPAGIFYGTRSLLQILRQHADGQVPRGVIVDYPAYAGRMMMIDVGRKPFPAPVLKDFIRLMAWYKMNELHLHLGDESKKIPGLAATNLFYTAADLRELQDFAKIRGITITPEIDMPGHACVHKVLNSSAVRTYIVPGAHYYGVSNTGIYDSWEPWKISDDDDINPAKGGSRLLGGKLHIWNDQGPAGYTLTEIAELALPSLQAFAEKLWGRKGSDRYAQFQHRAAETLPVPGVSVFDRIPASGEEGLVLELRDEQTLVGTNSVIPLPLVGAVRADLEFPWTLTMDICKTAETGHRGVILSSDLVEICADYSRTEDKKTTDTHGKAVKTQVNRHGIGLVRATGAFGKDPADSTKVDQVSRVYSDTLVTNQWVTITVDAQRGRTMVYVDGKKTGETNNQMVCPLRWLGSKTGNSFVGKIRNLRVTRR